RRIRSGSSYLSQNEVVATFGLMDIQSIDSVRVDWAAGSSLVLQDVPINTEIHVTEGQQGWMERSMPGAAN
ncbi:MAG: hypothetical protein F4Y61_04295, partial [Rhodothermaceae bacterium]|nr:hypothetical protein [Rhodothermaceae bacterium]